MAGGLDITHVPYKGSAPMDTDLLGGQITLAFDATPTALPLAQSGKLRALGAGMLKRLAAMPDLPTLDEQGLKGFECYTWNSILAPAGTPQPIVDKLNAAANKALADPQVIDSLKKAGVDPTPGSTPATTADFVKAELAKWAPIIRASGAQVD
jgi:tripartite-type tricarboxylate transporter receptor subunit TctC